MVGLIYIPTLINIGGKKILLEDHKKEAPLNLYQSRIMETKAIRISDKVNRIVSVEFRDILEEVQHGELYYWSILYFYGMGHSLKDGKSVDEFDQEAMHSERGILMKWDELKLFAKNIDQLFGVLVIGCKDLQKLSDIKKTKKCTTIVIL